MGSAYDAPRRYEIKLSGRLGPALQAAFRELNPRTVPEQTVLLGRLTERELADLLWRLDDLGLILVSVLSVRA